MKKLFLVAVLFLSKDAAVFACTVCTKQQPKIVRGITHGTGPQSDWDYLIVGLTAVIVLISLLYAVKWIIKPGEKETTHIKHSSFILDEV